MREIKFRGHTGQEWVYGCLIHWTDHKGKKMAQIEDADIAPSGAWDVDPESVGQFIGRTDKNGLDVYQADIVRLAGWTDKYRVDWLDPYCAFVFAGVHSGDIITANRVGEIEIIGNVFEHPEPLICPAHKECNLKNHACNAGLCPWRIKDLTTT